MRTAPTTASSVLPVPIMSAAAGRGLDREVDDRRAEPDCRPQPVAEEEQRGERDAGRGPDRARVTGRYGEQQRQLGDAEVAGREQERLHDVTHRPIQGCRIRHMLLTSILRPDCRHSAIARAPAAAAPPRETITKRSKKRPRRVAGARYLREHVGGRGCASAGKINFEVDISGLCECRAIAQSSILVSPCSVRMWLRSYTLSYCGLGAICAARTGRRAWPADVNRVFFSTPCECSRPEPVNCRQVKEPS